MLPSNRRIKRKVFKEIFTQGNFFPGKFFSAVVLKSPEFFKSRFAFSVSKKIDKRAVFRNQLRRQGYAALREFLPKIKPSFFVVFVFKNSLPHGSFSMLKLEIKKLLEKANLFLLED